MMKFECYGCKKLVSWDEGFAKVLRLENFVSSDQGSELRYFCEGCYLKDKKDVEKLEQKDWADELLGL